MKRIGILLLIIAMVLVTMVPMAAFAADGVKVQFFNGNTASSTNTLYVNFKLVNTGTTALTLSTVKMRYYFTNDGTQNTSFACDYTTVGSANVTGTFGTVSATNADKYLEVGFGSGAGTLAVGASVEVKGRVWKSDWSNFTQTNDYSFNATATNYVDSTVVTGYIAGVLVWGTEAGGPVNTPTPSQSTATPTGSTATPTPTPTIPIVSDPVWTPTPTATATPTPSTATPTPTPTIPTSSQKSGLPVPPGTANVPKPSGAQGGLSVVNWAGFKAAGSYTFDDNTQSQVNNFTALMNCNIPMTFYIVSGWSNSSNTCWSTALSKGCEIANHTGTHPQSGNGTDIDTCTTFLKNTFGVTAYTMAAPYGDASYVSLASSRFMINRGVNGGYMLPNDSTDPFNIKCNIPASGAAASAMVSPFSSARTAGGWTVLLVHGFTGTSDGAYQPVSITEFTSSVSQVKAFGDMWLDTVANIGAYWRAQKLFQSITPTTSGSDMVYKWTLPAHFPPNKYLRVKVTGGTVKQNGQVLNWDAHGYYEISLDAGSVTVSP